MVNLELIVMHLSPQWEWAAGLTLLVVVQVLPVRPTIADTDFDVFKSPERRHCSVPQNALITSIIQISR